jgi:hypothetical protein
MYMPRSVPLDPIAADLLRMTKNEAVLTIAATWCRHPECLPVAWQWWIMTDHLPGVHALQWKTPEGIEKHLSAQHTLEFLDHVKVMTTDPLLNQNLPHTVHHRLTHHLASI